MQIAQAYATNTVFWGSIGQLLPGEVLVTSGRVPIKLQDRVIGGVGCAGGSGEQDHEGSVVGAAAVNGVGSTR
jgi:uncharacterized protein GlcG (DUF336 family)